MDKERAYLIVPGAFGALAVLSWWLYNPAYPYLLLLLAIPNALALTGIQVYSGSLAADIIDLDELKTGLRREGAYADTMALCFKIAPPLGGLLFGYLLHWTGFDNTLAQEAPETLQNLRIFFLAGVAVPAVLVALIVYFYPVREERVREVRRILEERREARHIGS